MEKELPKIQKKNNIMLAIGVILIFFALASYIRDPASYSFHFGTAEQFGYFMGKMLLPILGILCVFIHLKKNKS